MKSTLSQQVNLNRNAPSRRTLKLLILCWEYPPNVIGGLSRHVHGLSVQLAKMGHELHVFTAGNGELPLFETKDMVHIHRVNPLNNNDADFLSWIGGLNLAIAHKVEEISKEVQFDLIHAHDWLLGSAAIVLKDILAIPLVSTIHATEHGRNNGIHTEIQQFIHEKELQLISESDHLIVCSPYMKENLETVFGVANEKVSILPNGIEVQSVYHNYKEIFPELRDKKYIFSIGRIVREKGFDTIINAAAAAKEKGQDLFFVIAGNGPMLESYRGLIVERNLENYIQFIGYVTDDQRNALISGCEMAVFPSNYEPFGIVALETMVLGKPTIVSNTGGLKGLVKHMKSGLLMIPKDAESLLEQVNFLAANQKTALEIGRRGSEIAKGMYGWKRIASETSRLFEDTLLCQLVEE